LILITSTPKNILPIILLCRYLAMIGKTRPTSFFSINFLNPDVKHGIGESGGLKKEKPA